MLEVFGVFRGVRGVLPTFETVVMYGHYDEGLVVGYSQIVEIEPKFPVFYIE